MRLIGLDDHPGMARVAPLRWTRTDEDGGFVVSPPRDPRAFLALFCKVAGERPTLQIAFDRGHGFDEATAVLLGLHPFGFYHLPPPVLAGVRRLRLRIRGEAGPFACAALEMRRPVPVAALHFLFNLRYRDVKALTAGGAGGDRGRLALARDNARRIRRFFTSVAGGGEVVSQQDDRDLIGRIAAVQALAAVPVRAAMAQALTERALPGRPLISFVSPVFETPPAYVGDLVGSFATEDAAYAELILVDDGSRSPQTLAALAAAGTRANVTVLTLPANAGIAAATSAGIAAARGEWLSFIDHDDAFAAGAIPVIAEAIVGAAPSAAFFYTDEIVTDEALNAVGVFCKPAYDPVLLTGVNYINHFAVFRRERVVAIGGTAQDREGSQDYDLLLRYLAGVADGDVVHIPYLAYRWRRDGGSYSVVHRDSSLRSARLALAAVLAGRDGNEGREGVAVEVEPATLLPDLHRVRFPRAARPLVSVVIPNRDSPELIRRVVADLRHRTDYPAIEIVVADNGSVDPAVLAFYEAERRASGDARFRADVVDEPFNFSAMCNRGAALARGEAILFLNNDVEVIEPGWLGEMVECLNFTATGIVGAKLLYPGGRLQHAGVIVGLGGAAGHWHVGDAADDLGPMGRLAVRQTLSAVTGACMLVTRACLDAVGGFDESVFPIAYNDIDLCLRANAAGFRTVWTPFATLIHHESASRGSDETGENRARLAADIVKLQERHGTETLVDPAYSPFYDRRYARPRLIVPPGLPRPRPGILS